MDFASKDRAKLRIRRPAVHPLAPRLSGELFRACAKGDFVRGEEIRARFLPLVDRRDAWGPARVLHAALELAGVARTGPIPPFGSELSESQRGSLLPVVQGLLAEEAELRPPARVEGAM